MAGYAVKQFDLVKNSTHRDKVLIASLNLARAKLFRGEHQYAVKMANYVSIWTTLTLVVNCSVNIFMSEGLSAF